MRLIELTVIFGRPKAAICQKKATGCCRLGGATDSGGGGTRSHGEFYLVISLRQVL